VEISTTSQGRLFHTLMTRSVKNCDLVVQLQKCLKLLKWWPRVLLVSLRSKHSELRICVNLYYTMWTLNCY